MASWSSLAGSGFSYSWLDEHVQKQAAVQNTVTGSSSLTPAPTPASNQQGCEQGINPQALQHGYLDFGDVHNTSASTPTPTTVAPTPGSGNSSPGPSYAPIPPAVNEDLAVPETVAQYPVALDAASSATPAADFEQAPSTYPDSNLINGLALRALLQASAHRVEQTVNDFRPRTPMLSPNAKARLARWEKDVNFHEPDTNDAVHLPNEDSYANGAVPETQEPLLSLPPPDVRAPAYDHGQSAYTQQDGQFLDPSLAPAHGLNPLPVQPQVYYYGTPQGYSTVPPAPYPPMGVPPSNYYGLPGPQPPYQYGYYPNNYYNYYIPNGSDGSGLAAALPQFSMPGFPMQHPFEQPSASLSSSKPLSASGRPNESAQLPAGEAASASSKRKRPAAGRKGKGKAKELEENVEQGTSVTFIEERADGEVAPPPKKARRTIKASQDAAGDTKPARKNRTYTQVGDNRFHCSHCGRDDLTKAATKKHAEMCGRALAANQPEPVGIPSMAGAQFTFAYDAAARTTQGENGLSAEVGSDDLNGNANDKNDENDVYADVAGPSSVTLEDIPKPKKKATKGKAAKKN
ncbi:hypothetical protein CCMSSC00406_0009924 [Pleurotus cornucopiae]|uniref:Uncharacterized protein n=1 Tax=Pleurotus cornucopiae TaxID=5321 RepID=A0ACB7IVE2_PLECO|nr:hypothetical protein CCMSSC00406_0009924 [Pleurotus cornucopiae]